MGGQFVEQFIKRWQGSGSSELVNFQSFLKELCVLLGVDEPSPMAAGDEAPTYAFERQVSIANHDGSFNHGRIDLYKRGCFVLESKQDTLRTEVQMPLFKPAQTSNAARAPPYATPGAGTRPCCGPMARSSAMCVTCPSAKSGRPSSSWWTWVTA